MPELVPKDLLIYHASTGTRLNFEVPSFGGRQMMVYHNITPPHFFRWYNNKARKNMEYGYEGIRFLADKMEYCIADSAYNREELIRMGYTCPIDVCPILIPFQDYDREPDRETMERYQGDGKKNWLFVGRITPNKKQEDLISAFYCYQRDYEPESRLFLIGNASGMELYDARLRNYIRELGIEDKVVFPGHIPFPGILACYRLADVFVCLSEHEGFCVPLVEAMYFGIPIIAYDSTAIAETLGGSGILLKDKDPKIVSEAINLVVTDEELRNKLIEGEKARLADFDNDKIKARLIELLKSRIGE